MKGEFSLSSVRLANVYIFANGETLYCQMFYTENYFSLYIFTFTNLANAFIQSDLQCIQAIHFFNMCVPWELNP